MSSRHVIARYEAKGHRFEILVNPDAALKIKEGVSVSIDELLIGDIIYKDAKKGLKASPESLKEVFGTDDLKKIAIEIVKGGELQLTSEQRRHIIEVKKKQLINLIAKNAIDPKTKLPIPIKRIEAALEQAKVAIDPYKSIEAQLQDVISKISKVMPIKIAKALLAISIPSEHAGKAYRQLMTLGQVKRANWLSNGDLYLEIEIPAGAQGEFIDKVNSLTKGTASIKVIGVG
ncbi:MAG: ribosome assembly factor SBDS [Desulfurococcaceae archaeon]